MGKIAVNWFISSIIIVIVIVHLIQFRNDLISEKNAFQILSIDAIGGQDAAKAYYFFHVTSLLAGIIIIMSKAILSDGFKIKLSIFIGVIIYLITIYNFRLTSMSYSAPIFFNIIPIYFQTILIFCYISIKYAAIPILKKTT